MRIRHIICAMTTLSLTACGSGSMPQSMSPVYSSVGNPQSQLQTSQLQPEEYSQAAASNLNEAIPATTIAHGAAAPATKKAATVSGKSTPANTSTKTATASKSAAPQSVEDKILAKARTALDSIQTAAALAELFEKNAAKGSVRGKLKYYYQAPGLNKMEFIDHSVAAYKGAKLRYRFGDGQVTGRPGGLASFVVLTVPMSDERLLSRRDYRLDQIDINATIKRLAQPNLGAKVLGKSKIEGKEVAIVEYRNTPGHFDKTITRELLGIDMQTGLFRFHEMYVGNDMVYSIRVPQLSVNVKLPAKAMDV